MQRKVKLVQWGLKILALLILGITTLGEGQLVTRASTSIELNDRPSCQLIKGTGGDTQLALSQDIPDRLRDLLGDEIDGGSLKYSLQCKKSPPGKPCVETSPTSCTSGGTSSSSSSSPSSGSSSSSGSSPSSSPNPPSNPGPMVNCGFQNFELVCSVGPGGSNGTVTCGYQSGQIACNGPGLLPLLTSAAGMPLPPNGTISCQYQGGQLGCSGGSTPSPNANIVCQLQPTQATCTAPVPQSLSLSLPALSAAGCQNQNGQLVCTIPGLPPLIIGPSSSSSSSSSPKMRDLQTLNSDASGPSCQLVKGADAGNTQITLSSDIPRDVKDLLEKRDGTLRYGLQCNNS